MMAKLNWLIKSISERYKWNLSIIFNRCLRYIFTTTYSNYCLVFTKILNGVAKVFFPKWWWHLGSKIIGKRSFLLIVDIPIWSNDLFPKLFWLTVRKKCSRDWENLLKVEAEGQEIPWFFAIKRTNYLNSERSVQFLKQMLL